MCKPKETVDENGKFSYHTSDMRPVPPGKYKILFIIDPNTIFA